MSCLRPLLPSLCRSHRATAALIQHPSFLDPLVAPTVMSAKRKRAGSHLEVPPVEAPRRSTRGRRSRDKLEVKTDQSNGRVSSRSGTKSPLKDGNIFTRDGLERAMLELTKMEENFQNVVKRQRLAVEKSDLGIHTDEPPEIIQNLGSVNPSSRVLGAKSQDEPDDIEQAPLDKHDAELAKGDIAKAKSEDEPTDRGSRRPAAVNSGTVPVPWKGRLGYVSLFAILSC